MPLFLGTPRGVFLLGGASKAPAVRIGLQGGLITHLCVPASGGAGGLVVAVPQPGPVHKMYPADHVPPQGPDQPASGLHVLRPAALPDSGDTSSQPQYTSELAWSGDARSCCAWDLKDGNGSGIGMAVGTEPADVFVSEDGAGRSWSAGTNGFASAASRAQWSFPAPPHEPHVLSLERLSSGQLVAGIEVGGVLVSSAAMGSKAGGSGGASSGGDSWEERSVSLYPDVHSCRIDPHDAEHWLAVTGRGLYASRDGGASWQAQGNWAGRYTVGLAFNPQRQGEVLVAAGDRPPANGAHVYHSTDGGETFQDITSAVVAGPDCSQALGNRTPVPYFWGSHALLGTATGHLLGMADAGRQQWRILDKLPHPILCMAAPGQSPSSVMH